MQRVFIGLGSNCNGPASQLAEARRQIAAQAGTIRKSSSVYRTRAWGKTQQADFLNQVLELDTSLEPEPLLNTLLGIEQQMGRIRREKWGPRRIDIDLLFYGALVMQSPDLTLPHPRLHLRNFVMIPLAEVAPDFVHPVLGLTIAELTPMTGDRLSVIREKKEGNA